MNILIMIQLAFVVFFGMAASVAIPDDPTVGDLSLGGRDLGTIQVTGSIYPVGPEVNLTGTIDQIFPQLQELYPELEKAQTSADSTSGNPSFDKRAFAQPVNCISGDPRADYDTIVGYSIAYLKNLGNLVCEAPLGFGCARVVCVPSPAAAVLLCNQKATITKVPCKRVLEATNIMVAKCVSKSSNGKKGVRGIQNDTAGKFRVAIGAVDCWAGSPNIFSFP
ncbi:hypothetical protein TWF481_003842 [Arthrobotrys musiformis]|uniref:Secreted protein n=1 Tax=Arthrobotrys musiformis TaxID=47236 RepID=A0AAV9WJT5_9PEZI